MEELLACRVCLITDTKLFDMFKYNLTESYEVLTGSQMSCADGLPLHICGMCAALLQKSVLFKRKCDNAQGILKYALTQQILTTSYIKIIDRNLHSLALPYTTTTFESIDSEQEIKEEIEEYIFIDNADIDNIGDDVQSKYKSDEEPLAKNANNKRKKKDKYVIEEPDSPDLTFVNEKDKVIDESNDAEDLNDIQNPAKVSFNELIKPHPSLWDPMDFNFSDRTVKSKCLAALREECNKSSTIKLSMSDVRRKVIAYQQANRRRTKVVGRSPDPTSNPQPKASRVLNALAPSFDDVRQSLRLAQLTAR